MRVRRGQWSRSVIFSLLFCYQLESIGARNSVLGIFGLDHDEGESSSSRCSMWTPRERRHPKCLETLQRMADGLTEGEFGPQGAYNATVDHAPEREWKASDPALARLYAEYGGRREKAGKCLQGHSVFFVGSSYMRQIVLDWMKYLNGTRQQAYKTVHPLFQEVPSSPYVCCPQYKSHTMQQNCNPQNPFYAWDRSRTVGCPKQPCGAHDQGKEISRGCLPGRRLWSQGDFHFQYQFSTYVNMPQMMDLWFNEIRSVKTTPLPGVDAQLHPQRPYQVLVIQAGVWDTMRVINPGPGKQMKPAQARVHYGIGGPSDSLQQIYRLAVQAYIEKIKAAFGGTIVWLLEAEDYTEPENMAHKVLEEEVRKPQHKFIVVDKRPLKHEGKKAQVRPMGHGLAGPVTDTIAKLVITMLCSAQARLE
eukprot:CAMPEP_0118930822 /NCGR_PEP_ID=MMETSP1169-20130426/7382_1 /TAXON_ID=36882 /ORGANISM="Pyramimonas obovata, Strain CCMP722" /LENGTH=418 /DNA_ID=CAMNT_0006873237 /DNA_START=110 /DNA_END=1366 /DNA_ORIENTATION=-